MLNWPAAKSAFPALHKLANREPPLLSTLQSNLTFLFANVGKSFKKPLCALLLRDVPVQTASVLAAVTPKYVHASRSPHFVPLEHRLCRELYSPGTTRTKLNATEVAATIQWTKSVLGSKSGQITGDTFYRYDQKDVFYHEKYQIGCVHDFK